MGGKSPGYSRSQRGRPLLQLSGTSEAGLGRQWPVSSVSLPGPSCLVTQPPVIWGSGATSQLPVLMLSPPHASPRVCPSPRFSVLSLPPPLHPSSFPHHPRPRPGPLGVGKGSAHLLLQSWALGLRGYCLSREGPATLTPLTPSFSQAQEA